jgi:hypothetical protein
MVKEWGLPERLYLDRGSEYNGRPKRYGDGALDGVMEGFNILSALRLSIREFTAELVDIHHPEKPHREQGPAGKMMRSGVTRSQPYNAPGKIGIEGAFAALEEVVAMLPGYISGDRMNKRTPKLGKQTPAWGSAAEFEAAFTHALAFWHNKKQAGNLKGKSPNEVYAAALEADWRGTPIEREDLIFAMSETLQRKVQTCGVEVDGQWYEGDAFAELRTQKITVRFASWATDRIIYAPNFPDPAGMVWIERATLYHPLDEAGAREAARRNGLLRKHISSKNAETQALDMAAEMAAYNAALPPAPETKFGPKVSLGVDALTESAKRLGPPAPQEIIPLKPGESVDRETGEVTHVLSRAIPGPRIRPREEMNPLAMPIPSHKKQGAGR